MRSGHTSSSSSRSSSALPVASSLRSCPCLWLHADSDDGRVVARPLGLRAGTAVPTLALRVLGFPPCVDFTVRGKAPMSGRDFGGPALDPLHQHFSLRHPLQIREGLRKFQDALDDACNKLKNDFDRFQRERSSSTTRLHPSLSLHSSLLPSERLRVGVLNSPCQKS